MTDREPKIGDVIRRKLDGTHITVCAVTEPIAQFVVYLGWWVIVDKEPQERQKQ